MVERGIPGLPDSEIESAIQRWRYETRFKSYLYRIGIVGNEGVESISNFPERIELNETWHNTLNQMREQSRDGRERGIPVGYGEDRQSILLPQEFLIGSHDKVSIPTAKQAKEKFGIAHQLGAVHSHRNNRLRRMEWKTLETTKLEEGTGFSLIDIFCMVNGKGLPMEALVEKDLNYFAFRTQETKDIPKDSPLFSKATFERYWYRKHGVRPVLNSHFYISFKLPFSITNMNIDLAEAYNLALYQGNPGEDLVRQYPLVKG